MNCLFELKQIKKGNLKHYITKRKKIEKQENKQRKKNLEHNEKNLEISQEIVSDLFRRLVFKFKSTVKT